MRTLDPIELECLLDFISPDGYVFDLSDNSFNAFTERTIGVRVKEIYTDPPLSKGKSLRRFVSERGNEEKGYKLLSALMRYYELKIRDTESPCVRPESQFQKCRDILKSYESVFDRSAVTADYGRIKEKFLSLYKDGAYWKQGDPAIGLAIALEPMTELVRHCIANKIDGLFSNPLFIRTLVEIQRFGGEGSKPRESQQAERAWNTFLSVLLPYISIFSRAKSTPLLEFKIFLDSHKRIYDNRSGFYRSISAEPLTGLCERCKNLAVAFHHDDEAILEIMYAGVFTDEWNQFDFLPASDKPAPARIEAEMSLNVSITRDIKYRGENPTNKDLKDAIEKVEKKVDTLSSLEKKRFRITRLQTERIIKELHLENMEVGESTDNTPTELGDIDKQMLEESYGLYRSGTNRNSAAESVFAEHGRESKYSSLASFKTVFYRYARKIDETYRLDI